MRVLYSLAWFLVLATVDAGYYKVRPPPPPPPPPGSIHYGPHPPVSRYPRPSGGHYPPPPAPHYPSHHRYASPSRYPLSGSSPIKAGSVRHYTRYPAPHTKPVYSPWKNGYNAFRVPSMKESFVPQPPVLPPVSPPATSYTPTFLREDDDKGPIHTIPAPNLGPQDKPANLFQAHDSSHEKKPLHSTQEDLAAVLKHGLTKVNVHHSSGYQVTEDPSLHQPHSGSTSFFAPDPDPELPNIKIPPTTDPHSLPSNGQVPLDLYLQQEAEKIQQHSETDNSNHLTAQDLFNLLNYNPANPVSLIPQAQLQQHVLQPHVQFYNPGLLLPQSQHLDAMASQSLLAHQVAGHNLLGQQSTGQSLMAQQVKHSFVPQFQTFNYDEQTQQGAYGSDSFPASSMNLDLNTEHLSSAFHVTSRQNVGVDNDVEGSEHHETYERAEENEVAQPQSEVKKTPPTKDIPISTKSYPSNQFTVSGEALNQLTSMNSNSANSNKPQLATEMQQNFVSEKEKSEAQQQQKRDPSSNSGSNGGSSQSETLIKPEENVQLQKSIQIYENTYTSGDDLIKQEIKNLNDYGDDYTEEEKIVKEMAIGQSLQPNEQEKETIKENVHIVDAVPYGVRIRPKRF